MNSELNPYQETTDLFSAEEILTVQDDATTGQRCLNFIIDILVARFAINYLTGYLIGYTLVHVSPELPYKIFYQKGFLYYITAYTISSINLIIYYTFCEKVFKGVTLGKLITGTKAVTEDGSELTFKNAILRSLARVVPFEFFSGFGGYPWHDTWTKTKVIKSR